MPNRVVRRSLSAPSSDATRVRSCRAGSPSPLGHHSSGLRSRSRPKASGVKVTSMLSPARHGDDLGHPYAVEGRGDGRPVLRGVGVADRDDDGQLGDRHVGQVRQEGVDTWIADQDMAGGPQPDVVPDPGGPVAYRGHPVPARRSQVGGGVEVHLVGARVHPGLARGALVTGAAGHRHRRDLHRERVRAARGEQLGHVVGRAGEGICQVAHLLSVEPDVGLVVDAVELEPDAAPGSGAQTARQLEVPLVPPRVP